MTTTEAPTWDQYMLPALRVLADGEVQRARQICNAAADHLSVSAEEREAFWEKLYAEPGFGIWVGNFADILTDRAANAALADVAKVRTTVAAVPLASATGVA